MLVGIFFFRHNARPKESQLDIRDREQAFVELFKLNKKIKYGAKDHYLFSNKLIQTEYEAWFKDPKNFNKIISI